MNEQPGSARPGSARPQAASVDIRIDHLVVDPALVPRAEADAYRARLTARLREMAAEPAFAFVSMHELETCIAEHVREAVTPPLPAASKRSRP